MSFSDLGPGSEVETGYKKISLFFWTWLNFLIYFMFLISWSQRAIELYHTSLGKIFHNAIHDDTRSLVIGVISEILDHVKGTVCICSCERLREFVKSILELEFSGCVELSIFCCCSPFPPNECFYSSFSGLGNDSFCILLLN